ncbi:YceI family protein [Mycobacterium sp. Z3061]|uniref:YceI family protein n=1 Tax=Mycobacterium sp. Z3061 TaxID=3073562 RepID=UPI002872F70C|nr:YceI family protein [Mycobacterium sp. Z3061]
MATDDDAVWTFDAADGELILHTGVAGRAARMGHRLTIAMTRWQASVNWVGGQPDTANLVVEVDSFEVLSGEGGVKGLSGPEKTLVRSNALKSLSANKFPEIRFDADAIDKTPEGYRLNGTLQIRGKQREHVVDLHTEELDDSWRLSLQSTVRQSDFGVKPYSLLMGSLQVADDVTVSFEATRRKA